jgi:hypothetical protein
MNERDFTIASYTFAAWTLRVEYEAVEWSEPLVPAPERLPVVTAFFEFELENAPFAPDAPESDQSPVTADPGPVARPAKTAMIVETADVGRREVPTVRPPAPDDALKPVTAKKTGYSLAVAVSACAMLAVVGWRLADVAGACWLAVPHHDQTVGRLAADVVARRIVVAESGGDATARNTRSSATGAGQFLDGTWLDMIRAYRPDLGARAEAEILDLRYDPEVSREMVARFAEENAAMLGRRCLPVTPGTL